MAGEEIKESIARGPSVQVGETPRWERERSSAPLVSDLAQWGLASMLLGCCILLASSITLLFNMMLFQAGPAGISITFAIAGSAIWTLAVLCLAILAVVFGLVGCQKAYSLRQTPALALAGAAVSAAGLVTWLIVVIDLFLILSAFAR